ncbi:MAG: cation:proton antiporter [Gammaproteobacteria bacterium]|nr:cation:proton antiporter [Gammaproteobacteria bacterium]MBU1624081.1 cation:proton antiporter [Gammaproteobacteria bacterium]MBU1981809.1 cation:proton antiporter [Gammaproteobacteria bacterium]
MITTLLMIATILFLALQLEEKLRVPSPLGLILLSFIAHYVFKQVPVLTGDTEHFAALVIFLLPVLLISDSLELKVADLKEHAWSLLHLAVVSIILSVLTALAISDWLFGEYELSTAAVIVLFAMVLATDPVSVVSIFSKFELPHRLKILAEGESLLNDATALIAFVFVGLYALGGNEISTAYVLGISAEVILGSVAVGMLVGFLGLMLMKSTHNRFAEMMVLLIAGYGAFEIAEHFYVFLNLLGGHSHLHLSGILAVIFAVITVNHVMMQAVEKEDQRIHDDEAALQSMNQSTPAGLFGSTLGRLRATLAERDRHLRTKEDIQLLALVANTILFIAMAEMIDLKLLWQYKTEILVMFLATTVIRGAMMGLFAAVANRTTKMVDISLRWWSVLTFAGIKGGLSIVMITMIPADYPHLEMFKAVVIGVIMLSTFLYSGALLLIIGRNKEVFRTEKLAEGAHH